MKSYITILFAALVLLTSCEDWLEVPSSSIIDEETVHKNPELAEAQFLSFYSGLRDNVNSIGLMQMSFGYHHLDAYTDDGLDNIPWPFGEAKRFSPGYVNGQMFKVQPYYYQDNGVYNPVWPYVLINTINKTISEYRSSENEEVLNLLGEAYFIRGALYFELVKRYGGVPLFAGPFDDEGSINKRKTEEESWNFVLNDLDSAITYLPENQRFLSENRDRANKYTAYSLKSRAALYAGTIAKYGVVTNNGLQGIRSDAAENYLEIAAESAKAVIMSGKYSLSGGDFSDLFDGNDENNSEIIFRFQNNEKVVGMWVWIDRYFLPVSYQESSGAFMVPILDAVEQFETTDGEIRQLDYSARYPSPADFFAGRDKRLYGTVLYPGCTFLGKTLDIYNRTEVITSEGVETYGYSNSSDWVDREVVPGHEEYLQSGIDGVFLQSDGKGTTNSGFYLRKTLFGVRKLDSYDQGLTSQDAVVIRYGEIVLNFAEAAFELGQMGNSEYLSLAQSEFDNLRARHGGLPAKTMTLDVVRHERRVDLMFEAHRYYDLKRWHTGTQIHEKEYEVLHPVLHIDETVTPNEIYYTIERAPAHDLVTKTKWFEERDYYCPLPSDKNPGLIQNLGWEGEITDVLARPL